jgi:hypothetical protein
MEDASLPVPQAEIVSDQNQLAESVQTVNGIIIEASNFRIEGEYLVADICYDLPSQSDWLLPDSMTVEIKGRSIKVFEWGLIEWKYSADGLKTHRCDDANFPIAGIGEFTEVQIVIPRLETSWPDSLDCDAAQNRLDAANTGIVITCYEDGNVSGPLLDTKPAAMSDEQAYAAINDAFIETFSGPWTLRGRLP